MATLRTLMREIRDDLHEWLRTVSHLPVVLADRSDPRPLPPYVSFKFLTGLVKIGSADEIIPAGETTPLKIHARRSMTVSIEAIGLASDDPDQWIRATDILEEIRLSLDKPSVQSFFAAKHLSVRQDSSITDTSIFIDTETEPRAVFDLTLGVSISDEDDPGFIDTVEFRGKLDTDFDGDFQNPDLDTGEITVEKPA